MELSYLFGLLDVLIASIAGMALIYFGAMAKGLARIILILLGLLVIGYGIYQLINKLNISGARSVQSTILPESESPSFRSRILPKTSLLLFLRS